METPSSTRRITRSQTIAMNNSGGSILFSTKKSEDSADCQLKSRQGSNNAKQHRQDRSALIDITNDSPIVGLAMQTPSSAVTAKNKFSRIKSTPGSGEALLRFQVKNLLQKVEEEAEVTKMPTEMRPFIHLNPSPMALLAPTPANTPQVPDFPGDVSLSGEAVEIVIASPVFAEHLRPSQDVKQDSLESLSITRSLLFDFSDKSESWESTECSSVITHVESWESKECSSVITHVGENASIEDDASSVWSIQVNASSRAEEEEEYEDEDEVISYNGEEEDDDEVASYNGEEEEDVDGLCEGMMNMAVTKTEFAGKHTRFVYDSEGEEIVEAKDDDQEHAEGVLRLKGLPTPKGKHFRFGEE